MFKVAVESLGIKFKYLILKVHFKIRSQMDKFEIKNHSYISKMEIINKSDISIWTCHETAPIFDSFGHVDDAISGGNCKKTVC